MFAKDIIKEARYTLSDVAKQRWTDERLLSLLDEGLKEIAIRTTIFVENVFVVVNDLVVDLDMSDRAVKIVRVEYLDEEIPIYSFSEMVAKAGPRWQFDRGNAPKALVYDDQKRANVKIYPIVENAQNENIVYTGQYGITTDISYSDIQPLLSDVYGDIGDIPDTALMKIYYIRKHAVVTDINQEIIIDEICKLPLKHYIAGRALRDNQDTQNRTMGNEELNLYFALLDTYSMEKEQNFVRTPTTAPYNPWG